jgi:hypothetical protein
VGEQKHLSVLNIEVKALRLPRRKECNMNRWLIPPSVLAVALAASAPPVADTQGRGEERIVISGNVPIYNGRQTKVVGLGQTIEQVDQTFGAPQKILKAGAEVTYVYQGLKVTFENGKVTDLQKLLERAGSAAWCVESTRQ